MKYFCSLLFVLLFAASLGTPSIAEEGLVDRLRGGLETVPTSSGELRLTFAPVVKKTAPAVVNVYASRMVQQRRSPFANDPFFERFFGNRGFGQSQPRVKNDLGSGVMVDPAGIVVTNFHVIRSAIDVKVALSDGREFAAEVILKDQDTDLAVLQLQTDGEAFPALDFAPQSSVEVGDLVLAIGNPFGVGQTVTQGIVSALARSQQAGSISNSNFFLQTDAAINPGNSGGALVDVNGDIVGINTAIYSRSGGSIGIGFAIPSDMVRTVVNSALQGSAKVERPWIGARFQNVDSELAATLELKRPSGVLVTGIFENGPADDAGLEIGDLIVEVNDETFRDINAFNYHLATQGVGKQVDITILRNGASDQLSLEIIAPPETVDRDDRTLEGRNPLAGAVVANLSPALAAELRFKDAERGVIVINVPRRSIARRYGVRTGDIIVRMNGEEVTSTQQLEELIQGRRATWRFAVSRKGQLLETNDIPG